MKAHYRPIRQLAVVSTIVLTLASSSLNAQVGGGNSYGYGLNAGVDVGTGASLSLLLLSPLSANATVMAGPFPSTAFGVAPAPYNTGLHSTVLANANVVNVTGLNLVSGLATANATVNLATASGTFNGLADSNVNGSPGSRVAHGFGSVQGLSLNLVDLGIGATTALGINASVNPPPMISFSQVGNALFTSDSTVSGLPFGYTRTGLSVIADLSISINGGSAISLSSLATAAGISYTLSGGALVGVAPNSIITLGVGASGGLPGLGGGLLGLDAGTQLRLILNEQILDGDPNLSPRITTTALHLDLLLPNADLTVAALTSLDVSGGVDIWLGRSQAQLVPEPSPAALGLLFVAGLCFMRHFRRFASLTR